MVALLVRKQSPPPTTDLASLPAADEANAGSRDEWFGVYQGQRKIGWAHRAATPTPAGYRVRDESMLVLAMLGTPQQLTTSPSAQTDESFGLRSFPLPPASPPRAFRGPGHEHGPPPRRPVGRRRRGERARAAARRADPARHHAPAAYRWRPAGPRDALQPHDIQPAHAPPRDDHDRRGG